MSIRVSLRGMLRLIRVDNLRRVQNVDVHECVGKSLSIKTCNNDVKTCNNEVKTCYNDVKTCYNEVKTCTNEVKIVFPEARTPAPNRLHYHISYIVQKVGSYLNRHYIVFYNNFDSVSLLAIILICILLKSNTFHTLMVT